MDTPDGKRFVDGILRQDDDAGDVPGVEVVAWESVAAAELDVGVWDVEGVGYDVGG